MSGKPIGEPVVTSATAEADPPLTPSKDGLIDGASRYLPTLDGWRAVAITAVILSHGRESLFARDGLWPNRELDELFALGRLGVDLFFAISGFLITRRLLDETQRYGSFSLSRFYVRRIFRILPPYLAYLAVISTASFLGLLHVSSREIFDCLLFIRNYTMFQDGTYTNHFWSLSVEEHFYLLWPLCLMALGSKRLMWLIPFVGIGVHFWRALDARYGLFATVFPDAGVLYRTDTRIDSLLWGCLAALLFPRLEWLRNSKFGLWASAAATIAIAMVALGRIPMQPLWYALLFPILILSTVRFPGTWIGRVLELRPLMWIGRMSYSLYLWQTLFLQSPVGPDPFFGLRMLKEWPWNLLAAFLCATVSFYFIEKPMIRIGHRLTKKVRTETTDRPTVPVPCTSSA